MADLPADPTANSAAIFDAFDNAMMSRLNDLLQTLESSWFIVIFPDPSSHICSLHAMIATNTIEYTVKSGINGLF